MAAECLQIFNNSKGIFNLVPKYRYILGNENWPINRVIFVQTGLEMSTLVVGRSISRDIKVDVVKGSIEQLEVNPHFLLGSDEKPVVESWTSNYINYSVKHENALRVSFKDCPNGLSLLYLRHGESGIMWGDKMLARGAEIC